MSSQPRGRSAGRRQRALRLLASEPARAVPGPEELLGRATRRRPGDLHDVVALSGETARWLNDRATACGVEADVLGSVLLEAALVARKLPAGRLVDLQPKSPGSPSRALAAATADYVRALTVGRAGRPGNDAAGRTIAVPVRLQQQLRDIDIAEALGAVPPETALAWELAAVTAGQTLSECVLSELIVESR